MHCLFDSSFDGLMTLAFDTYRQSDRVEAVSAFTGADSLLPTRYFPTDMEKSKRIKSYLAGKVGGDIAFMARSAFLSWRETRFLSIVKTIHLSCTTGSQVLLLLDDPVLNFIACQREVGMESHRFKGLLRFKLLGDGSMLAVFAPRNDVLTLVLPHFVDRFPDERLLIFDEKRHLAGLAAQGMVTFVPAESITADDSLGEANMQLLWRTFFQALAIPQRNNPRLQQHHLPKYTWKNLTEMR